MRNLPISSEYAHAAESRYEIIDKLEDDSLDEYNLKQIRYLLPENVNKVITVDADLFLRIVQVLNRYMLNVI